MREIQSMDARARKLWKINFSNGNHKKELRVEQNQTDL